MYKIDDPWTYQEVMRVMRNIIDSYVEMDKRHMSHGNPPVDLDMLKSVYNILEGMGDTGEK